MASTASSERSAQQRAARQQQSRERQWQKEKQWMEKRLSEIGKSEALKNIDAHWQSYTPFEMSLLLNMEDALQAIEARIMRAASIFESFRNMLIIVPIMLTWLSLAVAGASYEQGLSAKTPNTKPFLQQWQEGFAPLTTVHLIRWNIPLLIHGARWFTFATFALTDATLLAVILTMTIIGQLLEIWAYRRSVRFAAALDHHMYDLNAKALFQGMEVGPDAKMPPWLRELRTDLGHLRDVIDKMNGALDESMERYTEAITQQKQAVSALVKDTNTIHDAVVELNTLFQGGAEAARIYQRYIPGVSSDFAKMSNAQQRSTRSMELMVEMLVKSMRYLGEVTGHLRDAQVTVERYEELAAMATGKRTAYHQAQRAPKSSFAQQAPSYIPPDDFAIRRQAPEMQDAQPGYASWDANTPEESTADAGWAEEGVAENGPDELEDYPPVQYPKMGFWRRTRNRLSRIPVLRIFIRYR